jgi:hypothetical protein
MPPGLIRSRSCAHLEQHVIHGTSTRTAHRQPTGPVPVHSHRHPRPPRRTSRAPAHDSTPTVTTPASPSTPSPIRLWRLGRDPDKPGRHGV